jgi:hypothetical protein
MEEILKNTTSSLKVEKPFPKNEIFVRTVQGEEPIIIGNKLELFLEVLEKKLCETQSQLPLFVPDELYRQEIHERLDMKRKLDSVLTDINYLREYVYFEGKNEITNKDKSVFILGEIENLKMLMKRVETQQYEGLDLFRRLKKAENNVYLLAKELQDRTERERLINLRMEEMTRQFIEMKSQFEQNQEENANLFQEQHERILEIETTMKEEEENEEETLKESRSIMRSMSFSFMGSFPEEGEGEEQEFTDEELLARAIEGAASQVRQSHMFQEIEKMDHHQPPPEESSSNYSGSSKKQSRRPSVTFKETNDYEREEKEDEMKDEKKEEEKDSRTVPSKRSTMISSSPAEPIVLSSKRPTLITKERINEEEQETEEKQKEESLEPKPEGKLFTPIWRTNTLTDKEELDSLLPEETKKISKTRHTTIGTTGGGGGGGGVNYGELRKPIRHANPSSQSSPPTADHQPPKSSYPSGTVSARTSILHSKSPKSRMPSFLKPSSLRLSDGSINGKKVRNASIMNMEILDFLKTQFFEKLSKVEEENLELKQTLTDLYGKIHSTNMNYLKRILMVMSMGYQKFRQSQAFEKLKANMQLSQKRSLEKKTQLIRKIFNKLLLVYYSSSKSIGFQRWKTNAKRLTQGERLKNFILPRVEHWLLRVKPNLKEYVNRWKIFTIGTYRAQLYNGEDEDADMIRNANNQYFMSKSIRFLFIEKRFFIV